MSGRRPTAREVRSGERRQGQLVVLGPPPPHPEVVEVLESLLEAARSGHIIGVAVAAATDDRCEVTAYARGDALMSTLVAANVRLQARLLAHEDAGWGNG